jgi:hypothetical protein
MLGLADYLSDDDTPTTEPTAPEIKDKGTQSKKRVINVSLPLALARDDEDDDIEARPAKKVNAGSSLANLLPAPKNASKPAPDKKPSKSKPTSSIITTSTSTTKIVSATTSTSRTTTYAKVPAKAPVSRTSNPLLHLHRTSATTAPTETTDDTSLDEHFFPIADSRPSHSAPSTSAQESSESYQQTPQQAHTSSSTEASAPHYPPQQEYNVPYHPEQDQYYYQQQTKQQQYEYYDPTTPQGITTPYQPKGKSKREPDFNALGANIIEVNQKDMLKSNRPGYGLVFLFICSLPPLLLYIADIVHSYSEASRLAEIRKAKMSIPAPKPTKLQRSRHQLTALVYLLLQFLK